MGILIASGILVLFILSEIILQIRVDCVYSFRNKLLGMSAEYNFKVSSNDDAFKWFLNKWTFNQMVFSLKPLKLKYWFTEEELNKINYGMVSGR